MNKTITIDLGKMAFIIEESAYEKLNNYLKNIKNNLGNSLENEEIMADIETAIAEKLLEKINPGKQVITSGDVDELIKVMGAAEDFSEQNTKPTADSTGEEKTARRLYRNPDDVIIAGVCSGIAAYFDIDPTIIRLLFVLTVLAGGSGVLIYIILWLVMPEAKTPSQKLEMHGNPITIAAIKKTAAAGMEQVRKIGKKDVVRKIIRFPFLIIEAIFNFLKKIFNFLIPIARILLGIFIVCASLFGLMATSIFSCLLFTNAHGPYYINNIPVQEIAALIPFQLLTAAFYLLTALPLIFIIILGISLLRKKNIMSFLVGAGIIGVWAVALIIFVSLAVSNIPKVKDKVEHYEPLQTVNAVLPYANFKNVEAGGYHMEITIEKGKNYSVIATGRKKDMDNLQIKTDGDILKIERVKNEADSYCLFCNTDNWVNVKIITPDIDGLTNTGTWVTLDNQKDGGNISVTTTGDGLTQIYGTINNLKLTLNNDPKVTLKAEIKNLTSELSGTSYLSAWGSKIENANLKMIDNTKSKITTNNLIANLKDSAKLYYPETTKAEITKTDTAKTIILKEEFVTTSQQNTGSVTIIDKDNDSKNYAATYVVSKSGKTLSSGSGDKTITITGNNDGDSENNIVTYSVSASGETLEQNDYTDIENENIIEINGKKYKFTNVATDSIYIEKGDFEF